MRAPGGEGEGREETCKSKYMKNTNTKLEKNFEFKSKYKIQIENPPEG